MYSKRANGNVKRFIQMNFNSCHSNRIKGNTHAEKGANSNEYTEREIYRLREREREEKNGDKMHQNLSTNQCEFACGY